MQNSISILIFFYKKLKMGGGGGSGIFQNSHIVFIKMCGYKNIRLGATTSRAGNGDGSMLSSQTVSGLQNLLLKMGCAGCHRKFQMQQCVEICC